MTNVHAALETSVPLSKKPTIPASFAYQVARTPDGLALIDGERHLTYRELDEESNRVAWYLRHAGVEPEAIVGVCMPRGADLVIALLAILKCQAAYVPLDPRWPREDLLHQLTDTRAQVVITQRQWTSRLPDALTVLQLDTDQGLLALESEQPLAPLVPETAEQLCYVMYTSGSTGMPKGVLIPHRGVLRLIERPNYIQVRPTDRIAFASNPAFDASTFEIWGALLSGACLVVLEESTLLDFGQLGAWLQRERITILFVTTQLLNRVSRVAPSTFASLQMLLFGGEAADPACVRTILEEGRPRRMLNMYGPTECTTFATWYEIEEVRADAKMLPIGYPVSQTSVLLLSEQMQPVESGEVGEVYLGGQGLALGYLHQQALTQERFVEHPYLGRLYRTGDLAQVQADGALVFVGRSDTQIKHNGHRIELGEIEAVVRSHPAVLDAVVVAQEAATLSRQLVAYMVGRSPLSHDDLRSFLHERLRSYQVPSLLVQVDALPMNPSGAKVDRKKLRFSAPATLGTVLEAKQHGPRELEAQIEAAYLSMKAQAPTPVVQLDALDSLSTAELATHLAESCHLPHHLLMKLLLSRPTVEALAQQIAAAQITLQVISPPQTVPWRANLSGDADEKRQRDGQRKTEPLLAARLPAFVRLHTHSLLDLMRTGELPALDAAALSYLPALPKAPHLAARWKQWNGHRVVCTHVVDTAYGRIGLFALPFTSRELYQKREQVRALSLEALHLAGEVGAQVVALTGLLPSALQYGEALTPWRSEHAELPQVTTGHATTTSAVVMTIDQMVHQVAGRDLAQETVAFLGLGSIGQASLRLMLRVLPHPRRLLLCDLYPGTLSRISEQVKAEGYAGELVVLPSEGALPEEIYGASCIIGATNVPDILDTRQLLPGTLIIDDSGPHCFASTSAWERMQRDGDVLAVEAGEFRMPSAAQERRYVPEGEPRLAELLETEEMRALRCDAYEIMGCLNSGLLSATWKIPTTLGLVTPETSLLHYQALQAHGFTASAPHLEQEVLPLSLLDQFQARFGRKHYLTSAGERKAHS